MSESGPPTSERLKELTAVCELDPGSPAFVELGQCHLALGDPRQAVEVATRGLAADPANLQGAVLLSRAHMMLHEWKQAQARLLAVVKADRSLADGFRLLGEVLLRRDDYDRAMPVLQHAQNLDPANPQTLVLLKRARAREPLDPAEPIPSPAEPTATSPAVPRTMEGGATSAPARRTAATTENEPTQVAEARPPINSSHPSDRISLRDDLTEQEGPPALDFEEDGVTGEASIRSRLPLRSADRPLPPLPRQRPSEPAGSARPAPPPPTPPAPPSPTPPAPPPTPPAPRRDEPRASATEKDPAPAVVERVSPSSMGEDYLNKVLGARPRALPGAGDAEIGFDPKPDQGEGWGRSSRTFFIALFAALFLAVGGGTGWYLYAKKQRDAAVDRHLGTARALLESGRSGDLTAALEETRNALKRDRRNVYAVSVFAEIGALSALLYKTDPTESEIAASTATSEIEKSGGRGRRELLVAQASLTLAMISNIEAPVEKLTEQRAAIDVWLEEHPEDTWLLWLRGRAMLAVGDRSGAKSVFQRAAGQDSGSGVAMIDRADMYLDDGDYERAVKLYDAALQRAPGHSLAVLGRAIADAEWSREVDRAAADLGGLLTDDVVPRVDSYRNLGNALVAYAKEDYLGFAKSIGKSVGVAEPRYLARAGLGRLLLGEISNAAGIRSRIKWYGHSKPDPHPLVAALDAELYLAYGLPEPALGAIGTVAGVRANLVRGRAQFDQGNYADALSELDAALAIAPGDRDASIWREAARYLAKRGDERQAADQALQQLREKSKTKLPALLHGLVYMYTGEAGARALLEDSLSGAAPDRPNPFAYRAHVAVAQLDFDAGELEAAGEHLRASLEQNGGYLPAHGLLGRIYLATGKPAAAASALQRLVDEQMADVSIELAYAEAMVSQANSNDTHRERARQAVKRAVEKGATGEDLARVAWLVDSTMAEELGLAAPPGVGGEKRRGRRGR